MRPYWTDSEAVILWEGVLASLQVWDSPIKICKLMPWNILHKTHLFIVCFQLNINLKYAIYYTVWGSITSKILRAKH